MSQHQTLTIDDYQHKQIPHILLPLRADDDLLNPGARKAGGGVIGGAGI